MRQYAKTFHAIEIGDGGDGRWAEHVRSAMVSAEDWLTEEGQTAEGASRARRLFKEIDQASRGDTKIVQ